MRWTSGNLMMYEEVTHWLWMNHKETLPEFKNWKAAGRATEHVHLHVLRKYGGIILKL
jgi:hypothetical protein